MSNIISPVTQARNRVIQVTKAYVCHLFHLFLLPQACHHSAGSGPCHHPLAFHFQLSFSLLLPSDEGSLFLKEPLGHRVAAAAPSSSSLSCLLNKAQANPLLCSFSEQPSCLCQYAAHPEGWVTPHISPIAMCNPQGRGYPGCPDADLLKGWEELKK